MKLKPVINVPTEKDSKDDNVDNKAKFQEAKPVNDPVVKVHELGQPNIPNFIAHFDKTQLTKAQKDDLIQAARDDIEWVKKKLAFKLRKPIWQDEDAPRGKEKLIRMFNKYVQKRLDLIESLGGKA